MKSRISPARWPEKPVRQGKPVYRKHPNFCILLGGQRRGVSIIVHGLHLFGVLSVMLVLTACDAPQGGDGDASADGDAGAVEQPVADATPGVDLTAGDQDADLILANGRVYLGQAGQVRYDVVIRDDRIAYVGIPSGVKDVAEPNARRVDLNGRLMLPGLQDVHIHPLGIVPSGNCDLDSRDLSLTELVPVLEGCVENGLVDESGWLIVSQWAFSYGNEPSESLPTMRAALDAVSPEIPIMLLGNDGHHAGVNSAALKLARLDDGQVVGLSRNTLASFADYRAYIGVASDGEPNGMVNETARYLFGADTKSLWELPPLSVMPAVARELARSGITSVRDASADADSLSHYDYLTELDKQTFRLTLALHPDVEAYLDQDRRLDTTRIVEDMLAIRERYESNPLIQADQVKLFVDGVLEGEPKSTPPMLPNAAMLAPYRQPIFSMDGGTIVVTGYVDPDGAPCRAAGRGSQDVAAFIEQHGFHPSQCETNNGVLEHDVDVINDFVKAFDRVGFTIHAHAIGDRAVRVAVDAFEKARRIDGHVVKPHGIGHAQVVHPRDVPRIGALGLNVGFTYAWMLRDRDYDLTVIPFVDDVTGEAGLYDPEGYYYENVYPVASLARAGAMLTAGSDAPVDTRDPRPFVNIERAVTRAYEDNPAALNESETITIHAAIAAYTKNGAVALNQIQETGTIEVGKKADLIVLDRNIVELATSGRANEIGDTQVLLTVFDGRVVHTAGPFAAN